MVKLKLASKSAGGGVLRRSMRRSAPVSLWRTPVGECFQSPLRTSHCEGCAEVKSSLMIVRAGEVCGFAG